MKATSWILSVVSDGICIVLLSFATEDLAKRFLVDQGYMENLNLLKKFGDSNEYVYIEKHEDEVRGSIRLAEREVITEQAWL